MSYHQKLILSLAAVLVGVVTFACFFPNSPLLPKKLRQWKFEARVKKNIQPRELQRWAPDLIQRHPGDTEVYKDFHGTNSPPGLGNIFDYRPWVTIEGDDIEPVVSILWAHSAAIHVGSTNFVDNDPRAVLWKPGICFLPLW